MVKNFDVLSRFDKIPACDRQTSCHGIVRAMHTRRSVKTMSTVSLIQSKDS